ncbi:MAG: DUF134 domain-containing protein [Dehalococcoidia bacterium]|nr:DUF134 domain-containing protein [Dehalococcoidia bacterium]
MTRPIKRRQISSLPEVSYYRPAGIPLKIMEEVCLSVEEMEAVRLKDAEGLKQSQGAVRMGVSRPTFQRILAGARRKIAWALVGGRAIRIDGGDFRLEQVQLECKGGHRWEAPASSGDESALCPVCRRPGVPTDW